MNAMTLLTFLPWFLGGLLLLVLAHWVARAVPADDRVVDEWAAAHGLELTPANRPLVGWYLGTAGMLRRIGVVGGVVLQWLAGVAFGFADDVQLGWLGAFAGYLVGAVYAEVSLVRRPVAGRRIASLAPRDLPAYLPRRLLVAQRIGTVAVPAVCVVAMVIPRRNAVGMGGLSVASLVAVAVLAAVVGVCLEPIQRWLVRRPQPFASPDMVAADDAIRSQAVHSVSAAGLAILITMLSAPAAALAQSDVQALRWTMWFPAFFGWILAIGVCTYYGHRAWRVRRPGRPASAAQATP